MTGTETTYRAVRTAVPRAEAPKDRKALRARFGDLLVLMNPAVEATRWAAFDQDLLDRTVTDTSFADLAARELPLDKNVPYFPDQLPVIVTLASSADTAVKRIFPISRWMAGVKVLKNGHVLLRRDERVGLGHFDPYITHRLSYSGPAKQPQSNTPCGCPTLPAGKERDMAAPGATSDPRALFKQQGSEIAVDTRSKLELTLTEERSCKPGHRCRGWDENSPYVVVQTNEAVIADHNDVFNPQTLAFFKQYLSSYTQARGGKRETKTGF